MANGNGLLAKEEFIPLFINSILELTSTYPNIARIVNEDQNLITGLTITMHKYYLEHYAKSPKSFDVEKYIKILENTYRKQGRLTSRLFLNAIEESQAKQANRASNIGL